MRAAPAAESARLVVFSDRMCLRVSFRTGKGYAQPFPSHKERLAAMTGHARDSKGPFAVGQLRLGKTLEALIGEHPGAPWI
jgi:hypothetical protein